VRPGSVYFALDFGLAGGASDFRIFREPKPLKDPTTGEVLGYEAVYVGATEAVRPGETRTDKNVITAARLAQRRVAPELSPRELEVLLLIVKGNSNKEIGATLGLAENTVKNHVKMILEKLGVADRTQAATTALQRGLARLD
jgi:DNA-binding CsgD family transcriptional regulator